MSSPSRKKFRHDFGDNVEELDYYHSKFQKFYLDQHVTKFILRNMGTYPEQELTNVLQLIVDRAYANTKKEGRAPKMFGMMIFGEGLETPICIPARPLEQNSIDVIINEIDMLEIRYIYQFFNSIFQF
jgi:hypothetical protein